MKWTVTIEGVDLGSLIPSEEALQPHDYPLEVWAREVLFSLLNDLKVNKLEKKVEAVLETNPHIKKALVASFDADVAVVDHLMRNLKLTREE